MTRLFFTILFFFILNFVSFSQSITKHIIATSGGSYSDNEILFEWTIGEFTYTTLKNSSTTITQGFHQTFLKGLFTDNLIINKINVSPNPTNDEILIKLDLNQKSNIKIQLFDFKGMLLKENYLFNNNISKTIFLQDFANGIYQIVVTINDNFLKVFKIIKI